MTAPPPPGRGAPGAPAGGGGPDGALDRFLRILSAFDAAHPALTVAELARRAAAEAGAAAPVGSAEPDAVLRAAVEQVLVGPAGDYLRSHGGPARIASVAEGEVALELGGTCHACPAGGFTLQLRLEAEIRRLCPGVRAVRTA